MRLCGLGDNVVDRYVDHGLMYPGGNAVNVAVHARRSGAESAYLGVIGTDDAGDLLASSLQLEGVETTRLRRVPGETAFATVHLDATGNRSFGLCFKGVSHFTPTADDLAYLRRFDLVHVCETAALESAVPQIAASTAVSYDFSDRDLDYAAALLPNVEVATFSRSDASDDDVDELIARAHSAGVRLVIVTRGSRGAVVSDGIVLHRQPAAPAQIVDTLGAGDSFIARFVARVWDGIPLPAAAADAATYSAEVCGVTGGFGYGRTVLAHPTQPI